MEALLLVGVFVILLFLNMPIGVALTASAVVSFLVLGMPLTPIPGNFFAAGNRFVLLAIPFFILAGNIMDKAGISTKLIDCAKAFVGHRKNGMAMVCVMVSCFFAAISGSGPATVAALGMIIIPAMIKSGYSDHHSSALMATSGAIGVIIPPSITFVIYGSITGVSIGSLFIAGIIPGILMGVCLVIAMLIISRGFTLKPLAKATARERLNSFVDAIWALLMPVIILGGIYGGVFTPTEAAAVSAVYGLFVGVVIYRKIRLREFYQILVDSASQTAVVMFIVMSCSVFAYVTTIKGIASDASALVTAVSGGNKYVFLLIVNILLLIVGCFLDGNSALYLFVPILFPVAQKMGIDPLALGVLMVMNLAIGQVTPPVGTNLYVACGISGISLKRICAGVWPFVVASVVALFLITYFPIICTFLPSLMKPA